MRVNTKITPYAKGTSVSVNAVLQYRNPDHNPDPDALPPIPPPGLGRLLWEIEHSIIPMLRLHPKARCGDWDYHGIADRLEETIKALLPPNSLVDGIIFRNVMQRIVNRWPVGDLSPHYPDIIAADNGWLPLRVGETMSVGHGEGRYEIKRTE